MFKEEKICLKGKRYRNGSPIHEKQVEYILHVLYGWSKKWQAWTRIRGENFELDNVP